MSGVKTIGVYTPHLQGFFFGELVSQLQQYSLIKGYRFTVIKTDGFANYHSALHTEHIDYVVILRNAVHPDFAKYLLDEGKQVVSIAYDYFPLNIPVVSSDNALGVEQAFNYLLQKGHRKMAFVGDLSQYDVRNRYEAFCDQHGINDFELDENHIFSVPNTLVSGGASAAEAFIAKRCDATGVICASSLTSIGFRRQLKHLHPCPDDIDVAGFEAISLVPIAHPEIAMVDLNLHLFAYSALGVLERLNQGSTVEHHHLIEPKLISPCSEFMQADQAFLATSTELAELHNANYMKSVLSNLDEWPKEIVKSELDDLMMLAPMFEKQMQLACLGRFTLNQEGGGFVKVSKVMTSFAVRSVDEGDASMKSKVEAYPPYNVFGNNEECDTCVHIPIMLKSRLWQVLSVYGCSKLGEGSSSFSAFCNYMEAIASQLAMCSCIEHKNETHEKAEPVDDRPVGHITWQLDSNESQWDTNALAMLGLCSALEQSVYQNMDLTDRIHADDDAVLRAAIVAVKDEAFDLRVRLMHKNKSYVPLQIQGAYDESYDSVALQLRALG
ncbi:substrate-binding domain-containing protein [Agaribacterium sp. ZY112]|uniref:substrate-binding domain-containing protein n=1 Tax=Agaribacterium sp. ZY112 TaxID=3233574 RepID=UPI003526021C